MLKNHKKMWISAILRDGNRHTAKELSVKAGVHESNGTCPQTRLLIKELIDDGKLIGSNIDGYKLMTSGKEVQVYLNSLLKRQMGMSRRIQAVYDAAQKMGIL